VHLGLRQREVTYGDVAVDGIGVRTQEQESAAVKVIFMIEP